MISNLDARLVYENGKNLVKTAFPGVSDAVIASKLTQTALRLEVPLVAGVTLYQFNVLQNEPLFFNTETRLKQQDSAIVYQLGIFTAQAASSTDTAFTLDSYANIEKYGLANALALNAIWNGSNMSIAVNNTILVPSWDLWKHYNAPRTQQIAALAVGEEQDSQNGAEAGFYPMEPNVVLLGSKGNVIKVQLPLGLTAVSANSRLVIVMRCILAQNTTVVS